MAGTTRILAKNVKFFMGAKMVGCLESMDIEVSVSKIGTACQGSGNVETAEPGMVSYSFNASGIEKVYSAGELANNVSANEFWDAATAGTEVNVVYGGEDTGDDVETFTGYFSSVKKGAKVNDKSTYDVSGWANVYARTQVA